MSAATLTTKSSCRLNPDLGEFVSTIYSRAMKSQKFQPRKLAQSLKGITDDLGFDFGLDPNIMDTVQWYLLALADVLCRHPQNILTAPPITYDKAVQQFSSDFEAAPHPVSLSLIRLETSTGLKSEEVGYELHVKAEAAVAAALVVCLQRSFPSEDIFVATPHRIQRQSVLAAVSQAKKRLGVDGLIDTLKGIRIDNNDQGRLTVDTIERLQGKCRI